MRKTRAIRANRYAYSGFLKVEVDALKAIPLNAPYSVMMRRDRRRLYLKSIKEGWTDNKYRQTISHLYTVRGWKVEGERIDASNVFKLVRDYEANWKQTAPPDDIAKWRSPSASVSHHGDSLNHGRLLKQKREYNSRPEVKARRAKYRREHRAEIAEAERKRRAFNRTQGLK